jgi:hypothetical protein
LWLGGVEVDPAAKYRALERAIALDPTNVRAQQGLQWLDQHYPNLRMSPVTVEGTTGDAVITLPPGSQGDEVDTANDDVFFAEELVMPPGADPELRCPYCGEWTNIDDTSCARCQYPLIVDADRSMGASFTRWLLALLWLSAAALTGVGAYWALGEAGRLGAGTSRIALSVVALGGAAPLGNALPPAMLLQLINGTVVASAVMTLLGVIFVLGMLFRWRAVFVLQIITLLLLIASTAALVAVLWNGGRLEFDAVRGFNADVLVAWVLGPALVAFVVLLLLTLATRREFFPRRIRVRIPDEPLSARMHFRRGKHYEGHGWLWASAREYERAVEQKPQDQRYQRAVAHVYTLMGDDSDGTELNSSAETDNLHPSRDERDVSIMRESEGRER